MYSLSFDRALILAALAHRGQVRKGTAVPYVIHPVHVAAILERYGCPEPVRIAGLLHDALEDLEPDDAALRESLRATFPSLAGAPDEPAAFRHALERFVAAEFGDEVLRLVLAVTEVKKRPDGSAIPTKERREEKLAFYRDPGTPDHVLLLKGADSLHNAQSIANDLRARGAAMMRRFNGTPAETLSHYASIQATVVARFGASHPLASDLTAAVTALHTTLDAALADARAAEAGAARSAHDEPGSS